eukprot:CFRG0776T1
MSSVIPDELTLELTGLLAQMRDTYNNHNHCIPHQQTDRNGHKKHVQTHDTDASNECSDHIKKEDYTSLFNSFTSSSLMPSTTKSLNSRSVSLHVPGFMGNNRVLLRHENADSKQVPNNNTDRRIDEAEVVSTSTASIDSSMNLSTVTFSDTQSTPTTTNMANQGKSHNQDNTKSHDPYSGYHHSYSIRGNNDNVSTPEDDTISSSFSNRPVARNVSLDSFREIKVQPSEGIGSSHNVLDPHMWWAPNPNSSPYISSTPTCADIAPPTPSRIEQTAYVCNPSQNTPARTQEASCRKLSLPQQLAAISGDSVVVPQFATSTVTCELGSTDKPSTRTNEIYEGKPIATPNSDTGPCIVIAPDHRISRREGTTGIGNEIVDSRYSSENASADGNIRTSGDGKRTPRDDMSKSVLNKSVGAQTFGTNTGISPKCVSIPNSPFASQNNVEAQLLVLLSDLDRTSASSLPVEKRAAHRAAVKRTRKGIGDALNELSAVLENSANQIMENDIQKLVKRSGRRPTAGEVIDTAKQIRRLRRTVRLKEKELAILREKIHGYNNELRERV